MPIQILPPQLTNQIAAGEVVERPASVVKELVENSLDAGATRIEIDIEQGGARLIRIRDNGSGIAQADLVLALARHATSKIASLEDLEAISSLGFRGEALASISSVSRLILTSRTAEQAEAWQAYAEGREMTTTVKPAAHPPGTTVEVRDLFYNTPGRRKFLRTEKTEFTRIDELLRRLALARFDVTITLQHNGKLLRQYRAVQNAAERERRLAAVCGSAFVDHALTLSWQHGDLTIEGWIVPPQAIKACPELQYCYVNGRMMRDKVINHAIRQAYQGHLADDQQPVYILYLQVDPHELDVNVHPAKQEVRFHQGRLVHDFIYQAVLTALQPMQMETPPVKEDLREKKGGAAQETRSAAGKNLFVAQQPQNESSVNAYTNQHSVRGWQQQNHLYHQLIQSVPPASVSGTLREETQTLVADVLQRQQEVSAILPRQHKGFGRVLSIIPPAFALLEYQQGIALLSLSVMERYLREVQLTPQAEAALRTQPLLIPLQLKLTRQQQDAGRKQSALLTRLGIQLDLPLSTQKQQTALLKAVPMPLRQQNLQRLIADLLEFFSAADNTTLAQAVHWLAQQIESEQTHWSLSQAVQMLAETERLCPDLIKQPPDNLLQSIDLHPTIMALQGPV